MPSSKTCPSTGNWRKLLAVIVLLSQVSSAWAQSSPPKQTPAQKRVQAKLLGQKKVECAKQGKYAVATSIRGTTIYKCAAKPGG